MLLYTFMLVELVLVWSNIWGILQKLEVPPKALGVIGE